VDPEFQRLRASAPDLYGGLFPEGLERVRESTTGGSAQSNCSGNQSTSGGSSSSSSSSSKCHSSYGDCFASFRAPKLLVAGGVAVVPRAAELWAALERHGLFKHEMNIGGTVRLRGYLLGGKPNAKAVQVLEGIAELLRRLHLTVDSKLCLADSVAVAMRAAEADGAQAAVFLCPAGFKGPYQEAKTACLQQRAPGLSHLPSQWVNLGRQHNVFSLKNMALQLCAKMGHTPFVLDNQCKSGTKPGRVICGVDVCHIFNSNSGEMQHALGGLRLMHSSGEVEEAWLCKGMLDGESIPPVAWETLTSREACAGREVVVHRDGRFTRLEKDFLMEHAPNVGVVGGRFRLVEIVKHAAGTPRMYRGYDNAPEGSFMRLSDTEGMLIAGGLAGRGTRNPLLISVVAIGSGQPDAASLLDMTAEEIFRLSFLSYGSLYVRPRLPVTTSVAHKMAYFHASSARNQKTHRSNVPGVITLSSQCRQQFWL